MIEDRINSILEVIKTFTGQEIGNGYKEPADDIEKYVLMAMWVMMLSVFEGSIKELVENYIDKVKNLNIEQIHACILLTHFDSKTIQKGNVKLSSVGKLIEAYKQKPYDINYSKFTKDNTPKYKSKPIEKLFNSLGIIMHSDEITILKRLDGMASTRDAIAHGDHFVEITTKELTTNLEHIEEIFNALKERLKV